MERDLVMGSPAVWRLCAALTGHQLTLKLAQFADTDGNTALPDLVDSTSVQLTTTVRIFSSW